MDEQMANRMLEMMEVALTLMKIENLKAFHKALKQALQNRTTKKEKTRKRDQKG